MIPNRIAKKQPDWVCVQCGVKYGSWFDTAGVFQGPPHAMPTYHTGSACGVCRRTDVPVTEARDYGFLVEGWQPRLLMESEN